MREIKCRVWDKELNKFFEGDILKDYNLGDFLNNDRYIVTQYIGKTDTYGKDIYDGDIIHYYTPNREDTGAIIDYDDEYEIVKWNDANCGYDFILEMYTYHTVAGNIFENPELLEENNQ